MSENDQIVAQIRSIMSSILKCPADQINETSTMNEVSGWDSITHLTLIVELEEHFGVILPPELMVEMTSFAGILKVLHTMGVS